VVRGAGDVEAPVRAAAAEKGEVEHRDSLTKVRRSAGVRRGAGCA